MWKKEKIPKAKKNYMSNRQLLFQIRRSTAHNQRMIKRQTQLIMQMNRQLYMQRRLIKKLQQQVTACQTKLTMSDNVTPHDNKEQGKKEELVEQRKELNVDVAENEEEVCEFLRDILEEQD